MVSNIAVPVGRPLSTTTQGCTGLANPIHYWWEGSSLRKWRTTMLTAYSPAPLPEHLAPWGRCTPTVLVHDTDEANHMAFRGACLGCGWVAQAVHGIRAGGENAAAENANDHTHPTWRTLPVVERPPPPPTPPPRPGGPPGRPSMADPLGTDPSSRMAEPGRPEPHPPRGRHPTCPRSLPRRRLRHVRRGHRRRPP